uniref:hypothetical protein n=1 Tax=Stieleria sp. TaxID=2795976 RepID=UPI003569E9FB
TDTPELRFSDNVQLTDFNRLLVQRQLNARTVSGVIQVGYPLLELADVALSYAELWNAERVLAGDSYGTPKQYAVGDAGLANSGLRWGDPKLLDLQLSGFAAVLPPISGTALLGEQTLAPRVWTLDPVWSSTYFTPANPVWNVFQDPDNFDFSLFRSVALGTSLASIYEEQLYVTPFTSIYPDSVTVNNLGQSIFVAETNNSEVSAELSLVTYSEDRAQPYVQIPITDPVENIQLSDVGWGVYVDDGRIVTIDLDGNTHRLENFQALDRGVAISDTGIIAAAAVGPMGRGIYAINPQDNNWIKVVGESADAYIDPNEVNVDDIGIGGVSQIVEGAIGINGLVTLESLDEASGSSDGDPDTDDEEKENDDSLVGVAGGLVGTIDGTSGAAAGTPFLTVAFMAIGSGGKKGLHTARFYFPSDLKQAPLPPSQFLGHSVVAEIGDLVPKAGRIDAIEGFDIINNSGQIAFATHDKVLRATPPPLTSGEVVYAFEGRSLTDNTVFRRLVDQPVPTEPDGSSNQTPDASGLYVGASVATFIAGDPDASADQFQATIYFGDEPLHDQAEGRGDATDHKPIPALIIPKSSAGGGSVPLTFEVVTEHQYLREGPYVITVLITDTKNDNGGLAVTLANVIDVTTEEEIERLALLDEEGNPIEPTVQSFAFPFIDLESPDDEDDLQTDEPATVKEPRQAVESTPSSLGLKTFVAIDHNSGSFEVAAVGSAGFSYSFGLETAGSDGQGEPNFKQQGDGSEIKVRQVVARGRVNTVNFAAGGFYVADYETTFDGKLENTFTSETNSFAETSVTEASVTSFFVDQKTVVYDPGNRDSTVVDPYFDWKRTSENTTRYTTVGERFVDGDLAGQIDNFIGGGGSSFVGDFTLRGNQTTTETLHEFGTETYDVTKDLRIVTSSRVDHRGGRQQFQFVDVTESTSDYHVHGVIPQAGDYSLQIDTVASSTIIERSQTNGTLRSVSSGSSTVITNALKTYDVASGRFQLSSSSTSQSNHEQTDTNQTRTSESNSQTTSTSTLSGSGHDLDGDFDFTNQLHSTSQSTTTTTNAVDSDFLSTTSQSGTTSIVVDQTGDLYRGNYAYDERSAQTTTSQSVTTNGPVTSTSNSTATTHSEKQSQGNKKTGDFLIESKSSSVSDTQIVQTNQTRRSESNIHAESESDAEKSGNAKQGDFSFNGYGFSQTTTHQVQTNTQPSGQIQRIETDESQTGESSYSGSGSAKTAQVIKDEQNRSTVSATQTTTNQTLQSTRTSTSESSGNSRSITNTLTGDYTSENESRIRTDSETVVTNQDVSSRSEVFSESSTASTIEGNRISGESTSQSSSVSTSQTEELANFLTQTSTTFGHATSRTTASSQHNSVTGDFQTSQSTLDEVDQQSTTTHQSSTTSTSSRGTSTQSSTASGNSIVGDHSETSQLSRNATSLSVSLNGHQPITTAEPIVFPADPDS